MVGPKESKTEKNIIDHISVEVHKISDKLGKRFDSVVEQSKPASIKETVTARIDQVAGQIEQTRQSSIEQLKRVQSKDDSRFNKLVELPIGLLERLANPSGKKLTSKKKPPAKTSRSRKSSKKRNK